MDANGVPKQKVTEGDASGTSSEITTSKLQTKMPQIVLEPVVLLLFLSNSLSSKIIILFVFSTLLFITLIICSQIIAFTL